MRFGVCCIPLVTAILAAVGGCILYDSNDSTAFEAPVHAIAFPACGPADGPAMEFFHAPDAVSCSDYDAFLSRDRSGKPFIRLQLYGFREMDIGATVEFGTSVEVGPGVSSGGWAGRCTKVLECDVVETGTITFVERLDAEHVRVAVDLTFEDGSTLSFASVARECERTYLCG